MLADYRVCVREETMADANAGINHHVGQDNGIVADDHVIANHGIGPDVRIGPDDRRGLQDGGGMNPRRPRRRLVENVDCSSEGQVGVFQSERGGGHVGEIRRHQNGRGAGGFGQAGVFWVRHKGDLAG